MDTSCTLTGQLRRPLVAALSELCEDPQLQEVDFVFIFPTYELHSVHRNYKPTCQEVVGGHYLMSSNGFYVLCFVFLSMFIK